MLGWLPGVSSPKVANPFPSLSTPGLTKPGGWGPARGLGLLNFMTTLVSRNGKDRRFRRPVNVTVTDFSPAPPGPRLLSLLPLWLESDWPGTRKGRTERGRVPELEEQTETLTWRTRGDYRVEVSAGPSSEQRPPAGTTSPYFHLLLPKDVQGGWRPRLRPSEGTLGST